MQPPPGASGGVPPEQGLIFGEVADQYDAARPSYPDALFDAVIDFGSLHAGDAALEIGAGTGKATIGFVARGLQVHALEPSAEMARVLRAKGVTVEETTFETWPGRGGEFRLVYAAQAWHWVRSADRYERAANALAPGGTLALFWNKAREWTGSLGDANHAAYEEHAPQITSSVGKWELDRTIDEIARTDRLSDATKRVITWEQEYTAAQYVTLLGTHSDHRILPKEQRMRLHGAVEAVIDAHGGRVNITYDVMLYLATRR
jgi:SAM-dependent methyltransferase